MEQPAGKKILQKVLTDRAAFVYIKELEGKMGFWRKTLFPWALFAVYRTGLEFSEIRQREMNFQTKSVYFLWVASFWIFSAPAKVLPSSAAQKSADAVLWDSKEGLKRLGESSARADFASLASQFQSQTDGMSCGPVTGAIILNALRVRKGGAPWTHFPSMYKKHLPALFDPRVRRYTPESFMSKKVWKVKTPARLYGEPFKGKKDFGLQLRQLHGMFTLHGVQSELRVMDKELSNPRALHELISNLKRKGDYAAVNYSRKALQQKGPGHISPLGAYHKGSHSFLIMDVNSSKYDWIWVSGRSLMQSMRTFDTVENRGYLLIREGAASNKAAASNKGVVSKKKGAAFKKGAGEKSSKR